MGNIRIIGGKWRSRLITCAGAPGLRPTPARIRETLFNWLQYDVAGSRCLDLYAGSGALGFEAASRGARKVVQVENNAAALTALIDNKSHLAADGVNIVKNNVNTFLRGEPEAFDLIFLDPPFANDLISETCMLLEQRGWLSETAKIYIESERQLQLTGLSNNWHRLQRKQAGEVCYQLFTRIV